MGEEIEVAPEATMVVIPGTGEAFDLAVPVQAAQLIIAVEEHEQLLQRIKDAAKDRLVDESREQGTKTLRFDGLTVEISGGPGATGIDPVRLRTELEKAGCPNDRIEMAIKTQVEEKVDRSVCRQLAGANPEYKAAIDAATYMFEKRYGVRVR